eukprot:COSAG06_NODE_7589_length_2449_cov_18.841769_2_plen_191_part_00
MLLFSRRLSAPSLSWLKRDAFFAPPAPPLLASAALISAARAETPTKNATLVSTFPYVCPEPVLAKWCILYKNGAKVAFFEPPDRSRISFVCFETEKRNGVRLDLNHERGRGGGGGQGSHLIVLSVSDMSHLGSFQRDFLLGREHFQLRENGTFFEFSLCLSRACLGKIMHSIYKWRKKCRFLTCVSSSSL